MRYFAVVAAIENSRAKRSCLRGGHPVRFKGN